MLPYPADAAVILGSLFTLAKWGHLQLYSLSGLVPVTCQFLEGGGPVGHASLCCLDVSYLAWMFELTKYPAVLVFPRWASHSP